MKYKLFVSLFALALSCLPFSTAQDDIVATAKTLVEQAAARAEAWSGPTSGPAAQADKTIVYVSSDQRNGGALGVGKGVEEAAAAIGWDYRLIDGQGTVQGRGDALGQAIALQPAGIVLGGFDATEQAALVAEANTQGITVIGWHAGAAPGPIADPVVFTNITTPAEDTAKAAAYLAIAQSDGKAGVVIFTDSAFQIALAKSDAMAAIIEQCETCTLLETRVQSIANATKDMPQVATSLLQKYGAQWTHSLAINDLYFDGMVPALSAAGLDPSGEPYNISAGDGSESAYQRIRNSDYQYATVPEALNLQGWQIVDEFNRAFAGEGPSGFNIPPYIVVPDNVEFDGGDRNVFDPDNGYRDEYKKIWGK